MIQSDLLHLQTITSISKRRPSPDPSSIETHIVFSNTASSSAADDSLLIFFASSRLTEYSASHPVTARFCLHSITLNLFAFNFLSSSSSPSSNAFCIRRLFLTGPAIFIVNETRGFPYKEIISFCSLIRSSLAFSISVSVASKS